MAAEKPKEVKHEGKLVRLIWSSADDLPAIYANHVFITHAGESEFHLIFGYLTPPLVMPESSNEIPDSLVIKSIVKIVIAHQTMKKFVEAMVKNLEAFEGSEKEK